MITSGKNNDQIKKETKYYLASSLDKIYENIYFWSEKTSHIWNAFLPKPYGGRHYSRLTSSCTV